MENLKDENDLQTETVLQKNKAKKTKFILVIVLFLIIIFISAGSGAVFGFLASKESSQLLSVFEKKNNLNNPTVEQKVVQEDSAVIDVVKKTTPSVVSIVISKDVPKIGNFGNRFNFFGNPFDFYFGPQGGQYDNDSQGTTKETIGGGTGFFITADGMIVTNRHVVDDSSADYTVVTSDGEEHPAKVLDIDQINDIAIVKIDGKDYPTLELGDSGSLQIGQTVIAIGNSLGEFSNTVSRGIVSGLKRSLTAGDGMGQAEKLNNIIQTDAAINPGNSGGPLLNISGQVIGINVAIAQDAQNIGFAIPVKQVKKVVNQVKETGKISTPYLGVRYVMVDDNLQKENDLPYNYGALVARGNKITDLAVLPGSPADKVGIVENDILLEINDEKISLEKGENDLATLISQYNTGDEIKIKIWHKGEEKNVNVKLAERK